MEMTTDAGEIPGNTLFCLHIEIHRNKIKTMENLGEAPKPELKRYKACSIILSGPHFYHKSHVIALNGHGPENTKK